MIEDNSKILAFPGVTMQVQTPQPEVEPSDEPVEIKPKIQNMMDHLNDLIRLLAAGQIEAFAVVARHKTSGHFYTDIAFPGNAVPATEAYAYMGALDCLKLEFADIAAMAPSLMPDGSLLDPEARR